MLAAYGAEAAARGRRGGGRKEARAGCWAGGCCACALQQTEAPWQLLRPIGLPSCCLSLRAPTCAVRHARGRRAAVGPARANPNPNGANPNPSPNPNPNLTRWDPAARSHVSAEVDGAQAALRAPGPCPTPPRATTPRPSSPSPSSSSAGSAPRAAPHRAPPPLPRTSRLPAPAPPRPPRLPPPHPAPPRLPRSSLALNPPPPRPLTARRHHNPPPHSRRGGGLSRLLELHGTVLVWLLIETREHRRPPPLRPGRGRQVRLPLATRAPAGVRRGRDAVGGEARSCCPCARSASASALRRCASW